MRPAARRRPTSAPNGATAAGTPNETWPATSRVRAARRRWRNLLPKLDDWVDGHPDAWNYNGVLAENEVTVEWCDEVWTARVRSRLRGEFAGWSMAWKHGCMLIGQTTEVIARKAAAMFVSLWLRGVSASFADKLMDGYITFLERQEEEFLTFLAEIDRYSNGRPFSPTDPRGSDVPGTRQRMEDHRGPGPATGRRNHRHFHQEEADGQRRDADVRFPLPGLRLARRRAHPRGP